MKLHIFIYKLYLNYVKLVSVNWKLGATESMLCDFI